MWTVDYDVLDEVNIGEKGTHLRLCQDNNKNKSLTIRSWSSMTKQWNVLYKYGDIAEVWKSWKKIEKNSCNPR